MDALINALAEAFGGVLGRLMIVPLYLLFWAAVWGFWTERIISKAGFIGFRFWLLFGALNLLWLIAPLAAISTFAVQEILFGIAGLALWLGLLLLAILPWPIRTKPKAPKVNPN